VWWQSVECLNFDSNSITRKIIKNDEKTNTARLRPYKRPHSDFRPSALAAAARSQTFPLKSRKNEVFLIGLNCTDLRIKLKDKGGMCR
jgi:hypothetical protein